MKKVNSLNKYIIFHILVFFFITSFPQLSFAKKQPSNKYAVKTFWRQAPVMAGAASYFIRREKIGKKPQSLNNHPINVPGEIIRKLFKQLGYKYARNETEIPLFSEKELLLLAEHVPVALRNARPDEDITFVIKGPHSSKRWIGREDRLTAGRIFVSNNQLNMVLGAVQANLQPTLAERYMGNVWETTKVIYDVGSRKKVSKYEGLIVVYNQKQKGIFNKSTKRKDWFIFTNIAYQEAKQDGKNLNKKKTISREQYQSLQQQIDALQKNLNKKNNNVNRPRPRIQKKERELRKAKPRNVTSKEKQIILEQRLKTIEKLYNKGILSEDEYNKKRQEVLSGI